MVGIWTDQLPGDAEEVHQGRQSQGRREASPTDTTTSSNLPHSGCFLHHFAKFDADNSFLR